MLMGVTWVMEGVSYFVSHDSLCFLLTDIWNCSQGIFIFILFVLKRRVLRLMKKRFVCGCFDDDNSGTTNEDFRTKETSFT